VSASEAYADAEPKKAVALNGIEYRTNVFEVIFRKEKPGKD
jgi:hypothetical protein